MNGPCTCGTLKPCEFHESLAVKDVPVKPTLVWDEEHECWCVHVSEYIAVHFHAEGEVLVTGSLMSMSITYDQISEERGIIFKEEKSR